MCVAVRRVFLLAVALAAAFEAGNCERRAAPAPSEGRPAPARPPAADGKPITGADVWLLRIDGEPLRRIDGPHAEGSFPVPIPSGESRLKVRAKGCATFVEIYRAPAPGDPESPTLKLLRE